MHLDRSPHLPRLALPFVSGRVLCNTGIGTHKHTHTHTHTSTHTHSSMLSSAQECCYNGAGELMIGAPGGGSVDKTAQTNNRVSHFLGDVRPYLLCCSGYAPQCQKYYEHRPSDNGSRYQPPIPGKPFMDQLAYSIDPFQVRHSNDITSWQRPR